MTADEAFQGILDREGKPERYEERIEVFSSLGDRSGFVALDRFRERETEITREEFEAISAAIKKHDVPVTVWKGFRAWIKSVWVRGFSIRCLIKYNELPLDVL